MYLVDTNIHIAYLLHAYESDPTTLRYLDFYHSLQISSIVLSDFILTELEAIVFQVVPKRYSLDENGKDSLFAAGRKYIDKLSSDGVFMNIDGELVQRGVRIYDKVHKNQYISLADSLMIALALRERVSILSRDKRLVQVAREMKVECYGY